MNQIYTVTTISDVPTERKDVAENFAHKRIVGWYQTLQSAKDTILKNESDIRECYYNCALIEKLFQGSFPTVSKEWWFEWNDELKKYLEIPKPDILKGITNFGIG